MSLEVETVRENVENVEAQSLKAITTARNAEIAIQELEDSIRVKTAEVNRRIAQVLEEFSNQVTNSTTRQVKTVQRESEQEVRIAELEAALSQRNSAEGRTAGLKGGIVAGGLASTIAYGFLKAIEYLIHSSATPTVPVVLHFLPWWW